MSKKHLLLILFTGFVSQVQIAPLQADRPDQTETPALVPKGMFQAESGFLIEKDQGTTYTFPSTLWKYGLNDNFELRLITELAAEKSEASSTTGLAPVYLGCKIKVCEEQGWIPKTSFIGHIGLPKLASENFKLDYLAPEFRFVMQHTLSPKFSFSYNLGAEWDGIVPETTFLYTTTVGWSVTEKWGAYAELFGFAPQKQIAYHSLDGGLTYLLSPNVMLDGSAGIGLTEHAPDYYIALGFSFRI